MVFVVVGSNPTLRGSCQFGGVIITDFSSKGFTKTIMFIMFIGREKDGGVWVSVAAGIQRLDRNLIFQHNVVWGSQGWKLGEIIY